jgi:hypothetical protein
MVTTRRAKISDLPKLEAWLNSYGGETFDLSKEIVFVAEDDGEICGFMPLRIVFQMEPLLVDRKNFNKLKCSRAAVMLCRAAENWISGPENHTGIRWYFAISRSRAVWAWASRLGWHRIYKGVRHFVKHL